MIHVYATRAEYLMMSIAFQIHKDAIIPYHLEKGSGMSASLSSTILHVYGSPAPLIVVSISCSIDEAQKYHYI